MRDFFSLDGAFNKYGSFVADMLILSLLWILFSIPLVTIGASTTALFYVATRRIAEREGYLSSDFWEAFKANFKKATKIWLIIFVLTVAIIFNIFTLEVTTLLNSVVHSAQFVLLLILLAISVYIFPMAARFDMGVRQLIKSSFYMALRHGLTSLSCIFMLVAGFFIFLYLPPTFLLMPGAYAFGSSFLIVRIFKKYRPEMDKDPILEIQEIEAQKAEDRRKNEISRLADPNIPEEEN